MVGQEEEILFIGIQMEDQVWSPAVGQQNHTNVKWHGLRRPQGHYLFKQEIVHTLLLEEYGVWKKESKEKINPIFKKMSEKTRYSRI